MYDFRKLESMWNELEANRQILLNPDDNPNYEGFTWLVKESGYEYRMSWCNGKLFVEIRRENEKYKGDENH